MGRKEPTKLRVAQVTDTHVPSSTAAPTVLGLLANFDAGDPMENLELVIAAIAALEPSIDLLVGTGDLADTGDPAAYRRWRESFLPLGVPMWVLPGNHDLADSFDENLVGNGVHSAPSSRHGSWEFLYVRTGNTEWGEIDHSHAEQLRIALRTSDADHVFVWIHHPPIGQRVAAHETLVRDDLLAVLGDDNRVRAIAAGHTHFATEHDLDGIPVFVAPSTYTGIPGPGFRTFDLHENGTVSTEVHTVASRVVFDEEQIARLIAMSSERHAAEPVARRGAGAHARAQVEGWRDAIAARSANQH